MVFLPPGAVFKVLRFRIAMATDSLRGGRGRRGILNRPQADIGLQRRIFRKSHVRTLHNLRLGRIAMAGLDSTLFWNFQLLGCLACAVGVLTCTQPIRVRETERERERESD